MKINFFWSVETCFKATHTLADIDLSLFSHSTSAKTVGSTDPATFIFPMVRLKSRYLLFEVLYPEEIQFLQQQLRRQTAKHKKHHAKQAGSKSDRSPEDNTSHSNDGTPPVHVTTAIQLRQPTVSLDSRRLLQLVKASVESNFGIKGSGAVKSTLAMKYFSPRTSTGIIRVAREHVRIVWAALSYMSKINNKNVIVRVVRVSGTIKKCEQAAIERDKKVIYMIENGYSMGAISKNQALSQSDLAKDSPAIDSEDEEGIEDDDED